MPALARRRAHAVGVFPYQNLINSRGTMFPTHVYTSARSSFRVKRIDLCAYVVNSSFPEPQLSGIPEKTA